MNDMSAYWFVVLGVVTAVIIPVLRGFIAKEFPPRTAAVGVPRWVKQYGALLLLSVLAALVALAVWRSGNPNEPIAWHTAFLLGFSFESALEKASKPA